MTIRAARLHPYRLRLRVPLDTAHGVLRARRGWLIELVDGDGHTGWGDACPIDGFGMEDAPRCREALGALAAAAVGGPPEDALLRLGADGADGRPGHGAPGPTPGAHGAIETALDDLAARRAGQSFARRLGDDPAAPPAQTLEVSALVAGDTPEAVAAAAAARRAAGFRTVKLKIAGRPWREDRARLAALRRALDPAMRIRLDANGGYSEDEAARVLDELAETIPGDPSGGPTVELIEQPVAAGAVDAMARLRARGAVPIAADEAVGGEADVARLLGAGAADVLVLKPAALGGARAAAAAAARARAAGCAVIVTSLLDSVIGLMAAAQWAATLPGARPADGLATSDLFVEDVAGGPVVASGRLHVPSGPGLGVAPDRERLARLGTGPVEAPTR